MFPSGDNHDSLSQVCAIVDEFTDRLNSGDCPDPEEYIRCNPAVAEELRDVLGTIRAMRQLPDADEPIAAQLMQPGESIGGYEVLKEIGRGGMAVVFEARHNDLERRVALKVMRGLQHRDDLARFRNEAKAVARLHHSHIVPVYEARSEGGVHFIAMQYIDGQSLDEELLQTLDSDAGGFAKETHRPGSTVVPADDHDRPPRRNTISRVPPQFRSSDYLRNIAAKTADVANALQYAHEQGVLHRDVKPGNLMRDANGTVWLTDFGLAKTENHSLTAPGDVVGTIRYMAPERFRGQCDERSDVYSLGATLYEFVTGSPAFSGNDRLDLVRRITEGSIPSAAVANRSVPRDLNTIIRKATASAPRERYSSAAAMAADLHRFAMDQPITARRQTSPERLLRWARKNPAVASLSTALLVSLLIGAAMFWWQFLQTRIANDELQLANTNLTKANKNATEARNLEGAVARFLDVTLRSPLPEADGRDLKVVDVMDRAWKDLLAASDMDPLTRGALLDAVGTAFAGIGQHEKAVAALNEALDLLPDNHPKTFDVRIHIADVFVHDGKCRQAIRLLEPLLAELKNQPDEDVELKSDATAVLAAGYRLDGQASRAVRILEEQIPRTEKACGRDDYRTISLRAHHANALLALANPKEAIPLLEAVLQSARSLSVGRDFHVAGMTNALGLAWLKLQRPNVAEPYLQENLEICRRLLGDHHPKTVEAMNNAAAPSYYRRDFAEATRKFEAVLERSKTVHGSDHPLTMQMTYNLAGMYMTKGDPAQAHPMFRSAYNYYCQKLGPDHTRSRRYGDSFASCLECLEKYDEAAALRETEVDYRRSEGRPVRLSSALFRLGRCFARAGQFEKAEATLQEARESRLATEDWQAGSILSWLGEAQARLRRSDEVEQMLLRGEALLTKHEDEIPPVQLAEIRLARQRLVDLFESRGDETSTTHWRSRLASLTP